MIPVNLRLFTRSKRKRRQSSQGVAALYEIHFADKLKQLKKKKCYSERRDESNCGKYRQSNTWSNRSSTELKRIYFLNPGRKRGRFMGHADSLEF